MKNQIGIIIISMYSCFSLAKEGVSTQIDASRLNQVMEWVENSKYTLSTETENIAKSGVGDQERLYEDLVEKLLRISGSKPNEFLMRNVLYRTQIVYKSLKSVPSTPKRDALARRVLADGVAWAERLYQPDLDLLKLAREGRLTEAIKGTEFAKLGVEWADYMLSLYYSAPTNEVKLQLMKDMMGLMYNDINDDDAVNRVLAPISGAIVTKNALLQTQEPKTPIEQLLLARDLRGFMEQQLEVAKKILGIYNVQATQQTEQVTFYLTGAGCADGYVEGELVEHNNKKHTKCLKESSLGNSYTIKAAMGYALDGKCAKGFVEGERNVNSDGYPTILCIREKNLADTYLSYSWFCAANGYVAGEMVKHNNEEHIKCLKESSLGNSYTIRGPMSYVSDRECAKGFVEGERNVNSDGYPTILCFRM